METPSHRDASSPATNRRPWPAKTSLATNYLATRFPSIQISMATSLLECSATGGALPSVNWTSWTRTLLWRHNWAKWGGGGQLMTSRRQILLRRDLPSRAGEPPSKTGESLTLKLVFIICFFYLYCTFILFIFTSFYVFFLIVTFYL